MCVVRTASREVPCRPPEDTVQEATFHGTVRAENHRIEQHFDRQLPKAKVQETSSPEKAKADSLENWKGLG